MSLNRYAAKADANQPAIVEALRSIGCEVWCIRWPVDLLVRTKRGWLPMEVKTPNGSLTDDQARFIGSAGNCPTAVVRDAESAIRAVRVLEAV